MYDKFSLYLITTAVIYHLLFVITITISCKYFYNSSVIKQKGKSQNGCFKETKHPIFSEKTNISYPLIRKRTCEYQGVSNVCFSENLACFVFLKYPFWKSPFCLITNKLCKTLVTFSRHLSRGLHAKNIWQKWNDSIWNYFSKAFSIKRPLKWWNFAITELFN